MDYVHRTEPGLRFDQIHHVEAQREPRSGPTLVATEVGSFLWRLCTAQSAERWRTASRAVRPNAERAYIDHCLGSWDRPPTTGMSERQPHATLLLQSTLQLLALACCSAAETQ